MKYVRQDLLKVERGVIAHGCNYVGVMGAGVAKFVKDKYPQAFVEYAKWLAEFIERKNALGKCNFVRINEDITIANCITQGLQSFDGQMATPAAIKSSLELAFIVAELEEKPIYLPKIGAGLGGLDWDKDVEPIVSELATAFPEVDTYICVWP